MNLVDTLLASDSSAGDAPALAGQRGVTTHDALAQTTARLASVVLDAGVSPGDRVGLASTNNEEFVCGYLGALHAGAVVVPMNPSAPPAELERQLGMVEPRVVLAAGTAVSLCGAAGATVVPIHLDALSDVAATRIDRADDEVAVLLFTSGTAGAPRAAMLTHGNLAANVRQVQDHPGLRLTADDVSLAALPFHHVFGLNVVLGVSLAAGACIALEDRFDAADAIAVIKQLGVTVVAGVPTMYSDWLALDEAVAPADSFATVRLAVSGAAPLPAEVASAFESRFGVVLHQGYGLTEASPIVTTTALSSGSPRPGSIGPPLPGVEVRLVDGDASEVLVGDPGEVVVKGPNVFVGYWHDDEATARTLPDDGWLRTGDVAVIEDGGELRLVDRAKDLIIVSGFNVYPVEVEDVLRALPEVADAAVVGEPSARTGETVVAFVQAVPGAEIDPKSLAEHCARALSRYKCPSRYEVVDELPRNLAGKLVRRELRSD